MSWARSMHAALALAALPACGLLYPLGSARTGDAGADSGADASCEVECLPPARCAGGVCSVPCDGVDCQPDERCSDGECVSQERDADGDGFPLSSDCDDEDPDVIPGSTRPCETECGSGTRTCQDGIWQPCTAPTDCECDPGTERTEGCGRCGLATRTCGQNGQWGAAGDCVGEGACSTGDVETEACGGCGERARICDGDCVWGGWGDCVAGGECVPGVVESRRCGRCGTEGRVCGGGCVWGDWGACLGEVGECEPQAIEPCEAGCGTRTCSDACSWGACSAPCHCDPLGNIGEGCQGGWVQYFDPGCNPCQQRWAECRLDCSYSAGDCAC